MLSHAYRACRTAHCCRRFLGRQTDDQTEYQNFSVLRRTRSQQFGHLSAGLGFERTLLGSVFGGYDIRYFGGRVRFVTRGASMRVGNFVSRYSVHEGHERSALILVTRQGGHDGQADLLSHVVRRELTALSRPHSRAAVPHDEWTDDFQHSGKCGSFALRCGNDEGVQLLTRVVHRSRFPSVTVTPPEFDDVSTSRWNLVRIATSHPPIRTARYADSRTSKDRSTVAQNHRAFVGNGQCCRDLTETVQQHRCRPAQWDQPVLGADVYHAVCDRATIPDFSRRAVRRRRDQLRLHPVAQRNGIGRTLTCIQGVSKCSPTVTRDHREFRAYPLHPQLLAPHPLGGPTQIQKMSTTGEQGIRGGKTSDAQHVCGQSGQRVALRLDDVRRVRPRCRVRVCCQAYQREGGSIVRGGSGVTSGLPRPGSPRRGHQRSQRYRHTCFGLERVEFGGGGVVSTLAAQRHCAVPLRGRIGGRG